jgi:hypothetical protein
MSGRSCFTIPVCLNIANTSVVSYADIIIQNIVGYDHYAVAGSAVNFGNDHDDSFMNLYAIPKVISHKFF